MAQYFTESKILNPSKSPDKGTVSSLLLQRIPLWPCLSLQCEVSAGLRGVILSRSPSKSGSLRCWNFMPNAPSPCLGLCSVFPRSIPPRMNLSPSVHIPIHQALCFFCLRLPSVKLPEHQPSGIPNSLYRSLFSKAFIIIILYHIINLFIIL